MRIISLYSNSKNFTDLHFSKGCNIILGGKIDSNSNNLKQHNVGKTLSLELIDFCLLADFNSEKKIYKLQEQLISYSFFLQLELTEDIFLTICRSIQFPNVVNFIKHTEETLFSTIDKFEEETISDTKNIFTELISKIFDFDIDFRKFLKRFIRFSEQFINPLNIEANKQYQKKDINWKPNLMNSIGFDFNTIFSFYDNKTKFNDYTKKISTFKKAFDITATKTTLQKRIDIFNATLMKKNRNVKDKEKEIFDFDFQSIDEEAINKIINEINIELIPHNKEKYYLLKRIKNAQETLKITFNSKHSVQLLDFFNEVGLVFKNEMKKDFNELVVFNKKLLIERKEIAKEQLSIYRSRLKDINQKILYYSRLRKEKVDLLEASNLKDKYQLAVNELDVLKKEIYDIEYERDKYQKILNIVEEKEKSEKLMKESLEEYELNIPKNEIARNLILNFEEELEKTISEKYSIIFDKKKPNITIVDKSQNEISEGSTYTKMISVYFDLILTQSISDHNKNLLFTLHDNLFSDMQDDLKIKLANFIIELSKSANIQYIFTDFRDSLPSSLVPYIIENKINLVTELYRTDSDVSKTLFKCDLKMNEENENG